MQKFISAEPRVELVYSPENPLGMVVAAARSCYSPEVVGVEDVDLVDGGRDDGIMRGIYEGGHHTTFQHPSFTFKLSNISRQAIWSFLHAHIFYNSSQVSQRYVRMGCGNFAIPLLERDALGIYKGVVRESFQAYGELIGGLKPFVEKEFRERFPKPQKGDKLKIERKAQEIARYVLPVATFAHMYHTVDGISLLRYWRMCNQFDAPLEQRIVVGKMVEELLRLEPKYARILEGPISLEDTPEYRALGGSEPAGDRGFLKEFDASLDGRVSRLIGWEANGEEILADSVRGVLGMRRERMSDDEAVALALDPSLNPLFGETMNVTTHSKLGKVLHNVHYTFRTKLSHTGDSQNQRHRMVPGSRPVLSAQLTDEPDYITPELIMRDSKVRKVYDDIMGRMWDGFRRLKAEGVPLEFAMYCLPNALPVRFTESGDLASLRHKYAMRLCFNTQEEIWRAAVEQVGQIREVSPGIGKFLLPPCGLRELADKKPVCPEIKGGRYCGVPVWGLELEDYKRLV